MPKRRLDDDALNESLTIRINRKLRDALEEVAKDRDWSVGLVVREALDVGLASLRRQARGGRDDKGEIP